MSIRPLKCILLAPVLALLVSGQSFGYTWPEPRSGQPDQIKSQVNYDPKLSDPFFKSKGLHTAKCFTSFQYKSSLDVCHARLIDGDTIELIIEGVDQKLRMIVQNGTFWSQYKYYYEMPSPGDAGLIWTTKRQELTVDKQVYRKGDEIRGGIDFECVAGHDSPKIAEKYYKNPTPIKVYGVFKTIVK